MRLPAPLLPLALLLFACAGPGGAARHLPGGAEIAPGTLLDPAGEPIDMTSLAKKARAARYVLIGEAHDSACDHRVQADIVRALAARKPIVGLEMVSTERQPILDRFNEGALAPKALDEALGWQENWGIPFSLYLPIFTAAAEEGLPVAALNVPKEVLQRVRAEGESALPPEIPAILPPPPEQEAMLRAAHAAHGDASEESFARFLLVQSLWDTAMAGEAQTWNERLDRPVIVLAGAGHIVNGWGIPHRLRQIDPGAGILLILPWRGQAPIDPAQGDLFFYCPAG